MWCRIDVLGLIPPGIVPILNRYIPRDLGAGYMADQGIGQVLGYLLLVAAPVVFWAGVTLTHNATKDDPVNLRMGFTIVMVITFSSIITLMVVAGLWLVFGGVEGYSK